MDGFRYSLCNKNFCIHHQLSHHRLGWLNTKCWCPGLSDFFIFHLGVSGQLGGRRREDLSIETPGGLTQWTAKSLGKSHTKWRLMEHTSFSTLVCPNNHGISKLVVWKSKSTLRKTDPKLSFSEGPMILSVGERQKCWESGSCYFPWSGIRNHQVTKS